MRGNTRKVIRSFRLYDLEKDGNEIEYVVNSSFNKIIVFDSELLRIVEAADAGTGKEGGPDYIPGLISLKIGRSTTVYRENILPYNGEIILKHVKRVDVNKGKTDKNGKRLPKEKELQPVLDADGRQVQEKFVRLIAGSSQGRAKKALYVREDLYDDVNKVLLGGMDELSEMNQYPAFAGGYAKWNAYYGLASTDSVAMDYVPNIVVVKDFEREVNDVFDVLHPYQKTYLLDGVEKLSTEYAVENNRTLTKTINPFDGAGLISVECAVRWAGKLGLDPADPPGAFQIRAIPGIKGVLYTFDIKAFGRKYGGSIGSKAPEDVDIILTESQVKFLKMYGGDLNCWREIFDKPVTLKNGTVYKRTFNVSDYSVNPENLKSRTRSSYQPWQTIHNTEKECARAAFYTLRQLEKISLDKDAFLKYRCGIGESDSDEPDLAYVPSYYKAAYFADDKSRQNIFMDPFFQEKMEQDLEGAYRRALTGKLSIMGNYQFLVPDIYALAQHCFGLEVTGLLQAGKIYSNWWIAQDEATQDQAYDEAYESGTEPDIKRLNRYACEELALIRNPHIYMEARIARMASGETDGWDCFEDMKAWYKYQTTGIITDSYSTIPLALGTADFDGDTIITTNSREYIEGVKRALRDGNGNTIILEEEEADDKKKALYAKDVRDRAALLEADLRAYTNDIGSVINKVTSLWGIPWRVLDRKAARLDDGKSSVRDYIKVMDIIGQQTIDSAKTGEAMEIPYNIKRFFEVSKTGKPYFMKYRDKRTSLPKQAEQIRPIDENANNMDRFCHLVEQKLVEIKRLKSEGAAQEAHAFSTEAFLKLFVKGGYPARDSALYKSVKDELAAMSEQNNGLFKFLLREEKDDKTPHYRYLYHYAKEAFLKLDDAPDRVLDYLIYICYADEDLLADNGSKNILWNCFEDEMIERAKRRGNSAADFSGLDEETAKIRARLKKEKKEKAEAQPLCIGVLEDKRKTYHRIRISRREIEMIREKIPGGRLADKQLRRLYGVLMVIYKYWGKVVVKKGGNNDLTRMALAQLCNMKSQRKTIYDKLKKLQELGAIEMKDEVLANIKIQVVCGKAEKDETIEIDTEDYKEACEKIIKLADKVK